MTKRIALRIAAPFVALGIVLGTMFPASAIWSYYNDYVCTQEGCNNAYWDPQYPTFQVLRLETGDGEARTYVFDTMLEGTGGEEFVVEFRYRGVGGLAGVGIFSINNHGYAGWACSSSQTAPSLGYVIRKCWFTNPPEGSSNIRVYAHGTGTHTNIKYIKITSVK